MLAHFSKHYRTSGSNGEQTLQIGIRSPKVSSIKLQLQLIVT